MIQINELTKIYKLTKKQMMEHKTKKYDEGSGQYKLNCQAR